MPRLKNPAKPRLGHLTIFCRPEYFTYVWQTWLLEGGGISFGYWVVGQAVRNAIERGYFFRGGEELPPFAIPDGIFNCLDASTRNVKLSVRISESLQEGLREVWLRERRNRIDTRGFGAWVAWQAVKQTVKESIASLSEG